MAKIPPKPPQMNKDAVDKILAAKGIDRQKYPVCILGVRGYFKNTMGLPGVNDRGLFDDAAFVSSPTAFVAVNFNTDSSIYRKGKGTGAGKGVANLAEGEWLYQVGKHKGKGPALNQAAKVTVMRDGEVRPYPETGMFGINHHWGSATGTSSLGCQTVPPAQWPTYINTIVAELKRYGKKIVMYVLITEDEMNELKGSSPSPIIVAPAEPVIIAPPKSVAMSSKMVRLPARGPTIRGMDISNYQPKVNYAACKAAGIEFCWAKATEGTTVYHKTYTTHRDGCRAAGILFGGYHFFRSTSPVEKQLAHFLAKLGRVLPTDLPPMLDVEQHNGASPAKMVEMVREFCEGIEEATGRRPVIYTGPYFWKDRMGKGASGFEKYPLWIAHYAAENRVDKVVSPLTPPPWASWDIHQFTSRGPIAGHPGGGDLNRFNGTLAEFRAKFLA